MQFSEHPQWHSHAYKHRISRYHDTETPISRSQVQTGQITKL